MATALFWKDRELLYALREYLLQIQINYLESVSGWFRSKPKEDFEEEFTTQQLDQIDRFWKELKYKVGRKYIKVSERNSAHSFIVMEDDSKFKRGDILKPASYATPKRNFSRGNILTGNYTANWTGPW